MDGSAAERMDDKRDYDDINMAAESNPDTSPSSTQHQQSQQTQPQQRNASLHLTSEEKRLFMLLVNAAESYERGELLILDNNSDSTPPPPQLLDHNIEIRIAGGWVRDKLLNQHSVDVDVALDCMMGVQFARIVQCYLMSLEGEHENDDDYEGDVMKDDREDDNDASHQQQQKKNNGQEQNHSNNCYIKPQINQCGQETKKKKSKKSKNKGRLPKIGVIGANPSQSKHLETATMNIHGIDVDFVNLRAEEVYEANSRIPTSQTRMFGTPLEDALRRDFTINSLFYNIRTGLIEDWTGRGLTDLLENRLIVTPVDPHVTFHDDPLRVLRAIRFAVRLDFSLHDEIQQAAMSKRVHHSLHVKVSRERVGKELEGMMTGKHARPGQALDMIAALHLAGSVFAFPGSFAGDFGHVTGPVTGTILGLDYHGCCGRDGPEAVALAATHRARGWVESSALLALLPKLMESHVDERDRFLVQRQSDEEEDCHESSSSTPSPSTMDSRLLHICAFILPFHNLTFPDTKGRQSSVTTHMIKEAVKWSTKDIQAISKILEHVDEMAEILSEIRSHLVLQQQQSKEGGGDDNTFQALPPPCRLRSGLLLRSLKEHWITCLLTAAAWEIRSYHRLREFNGGVVSSSEDDEQPSRIFYRVIVGELDLDECWRVRPHLNGKEIIKELSLPKGPLVGMYVEDQTRWMLLNPKGTREECMSHLVERKREREQDLVKGDDDDVILIAEQNESNIGVANGVGQTDPDDQDGSTRHFSKKIRPDSELPTYEN